MDDATRSLLALWDVTEDAVGTMAPPDWARRTPCPDMDVTDLVIHLAGIHYAGPDRLREGLAAGRARTAHRLADRTAGDRVLGTHCLDLCLHAHDLTSALGDPVDLAAHAPAALEACRLVVDVAPRLLVAALGGRDATVRLVVHGADGGAGLERTIHVVEGHTAPLSGGAPADVLEVEASALLLLLAGRRDADALEAAGAVRWTGSAADAFVHRARLVG
jgi:hypothetical protein